MQDLAATSGLRGRDLLASSDLDADDLRAIFELAARMKSEFRLFARALAGRAAILLFEKPSLRTRVSFEVGLARLGAHAIYYDHSAHPIGVRESVKDYALNLERWVDLIIARVFDHRVLVEMAGHTAVPVVNALSDAQHPCQALADVFTLSERLGGLERLAGSRLAYIGDGNNVCASLVHTAATLGVNVTVITPSGYEPAAEAVEGAQAAGRRTGASVVLSSRPRDVERHHAVYTDTWISMGQDTEADTRRRAFAGFQVSGATMEAASRGIKGGAAFMHCLPAKRNEEVTDEVIDSAASLVYDQAENRMHVQNALLYHVLGPGA